MKRHIRVACAVLVCASLFFGFAACLAPTASATEYAPDPFVFPFECPDDYIVFTDWDRSYARLYIFSVSGDGYLRLGNKRSNGIRYITCTPVSNDPNFSYTIFMFSGGYSDPIADTYFFTGYYEFEPHLDVEFQYASSGAVLFDDGFSFDYSSELFPSILWGQDGFTFQMYMDSLKQSNNFLADIAQSISQFFSNWYQDLRGLFDGVISKIDEVIAAIRNNGSGGSGGGSVTNVTNNYNSYSASAEPPGILEDGSVVYPFHEPKTWFSVAGTSAGRPVYYFFFFDYATTYAGALGADMVNNGSYTTFTFSLNDSGNTSRLSVFGFRVQDDKLYYLTVNQNGPSYSVTDTVTVLTPTSFNFGNTNSSLAFGISDTFGSTIHSVYFTGDIVPGQETDYGKDDDISHVQDSTSAVQDKIDELSSSEKDLLNNAGNALTSLPSTLTTLPASLSAYQGNTYIVNYFLMSPIVEPFFNVACIFLVIFSVFSGKWWKEQ